MLLNSLLYQLFNKPILPTGTTNDMSSMLPTGDYFHSFKWYTDYRYGHTSSKNMSTNEINRTCNMLNNVPCWLMEHFDLLIDSYSIVCLWQLFDSQEITAVGSRLLEQFLPSQNDSERNLQKVCRLNLIKCFLQFCLLTCDPGTST